MKHGVLYVDKNPDMPRLNDKHNKLSNVTGADENERCSTQEGRRLGCLLHGGALGPPRHLIVCHLLSMSRGARVRRRGRLLVSPRLN